MTFYILFNHSITGTLLATGKNANPLFAIGMVGGDYWMLNMEKSKYT